MTEEKLRRSVDNLGRALDRLGEALDEPVENRLAVDGTIQRFEFAIALLWKTLKRLLQSEGVEAGTPKETLRAAFRAGWLHDEAPWLGMLDDRNRTSHIYDEAEAVAIYRRIATYFGPMLTLHAWMTGRVAGMDAATGDAPIAGQTSAGTGNRTRS